jgi:hypothetical protein
LRAWLCGGSRRIVVAIQLDQVEGVEEDTIVVAAMANEIDDPTSLFSPATASPSLMRDRQRTKPPAGLTDDNAESVVARRRRGTREYWWENTAQRSRPGG